FLKRLSNFRRLVFTLLAHSMPWLRATLEGAERLAMNSGVLDAVNGDIPELANRLRSWLGAGNRVAIASDQPHRVAELLAAQQIPVHALEPGKPLPAADERLAPVFHGRRPAGGWLPGVRYDLPPGAASFGHRRA